MANERTSWIDFLRGILIVLVVVGHSQVGFSKYIYWFHMPAFFMLSGYLFKPVANWKDWKSYALKKTTSLLIPYSLFLILFLVARCLYFYLTQTPFNYSLEIHNALYGGRVVLGVYGALWFITVLWFTQIVYSKINLVFKKQWLITLVVFIAYLLSHIESWHLVNTGHLRPIPLNVDVALITLAYFHISFLLKELSNKLHFTKTQLLAGTVVFSLLSLILVVLATTGHLAYTLDLKNIVYDHPYLDLLIPTIVTLALVGLSYYLVKLDRWKLIILLGLYSLPIMYLHRTFGLLFGNHSAGHWILYTLVGVCGSLGIGLLFNKWKTTRFLFLGKSSYEIV